MQINEINSFFFFFIKNKKSVLKGGINLNLFVFIISLKNFFYLFTFIINHIKISRK